MLRIALSTLAARKGGMFGAFAAVCLAVILVVSCGILLESSMQTPIPVERLRAAAVVVQTNPAISGGGEVGIWLHERTRLPAELADQIQTLPGVRAAIADRSFSIQVIDRDGRLLTGRDEAPPVGHGWASAELTPFVLTSGHLPRSSTETVLATDLAARGSVQLGDRVQVVTANTRSSFTVVGAAAASSGHRLSRESAVFFRDDVAARLSGSSDRADLIGVLLEPGADRDTVAERVGKGLDSPGLRVLTGAKRGEAESPEDAFGREDTVAGLSTFALLAAFIAVFVVASTFALSVQQRHRELALFRAIGSTPRQVRRMVAGEALLVSIAAFVAAAPISVFAARLEQGLFASVGVLPAGLHVVVGWLPFVAGLVAAITTTQLAAFTSARRASRIRPTDALREAAVQQRSISMIRGLAGLAFLAGGLAVLTASGGGRDGGAPAAALVWMLAVALLGPALAWPFAWLIGLPLAAFSRGPGMLAGANARANLRRVASVATPMMLAISLVCTICFAKTILQQQTSEQTAERTTAEYVLRAQAAPGMPADTAAAVRYVPGVAEASGSFATSVIATEGTNLRSFPARAVDASTLAGVIDLGVVSGSLADLHGRSLAVGTDTAKLLGWHAGDHVTLRLGDGTPATLLVVATYSRPLGFGDVLLPRPLAGRHVTHSFDDAVFIKKDPGADPRVLVAGLAELARGNPAIKITTRSQYENGLEAAAQQQSLAVYVLLGLIVAFCALAVVNAVTMSTGERAREFALLRLIGAGKDQIRAMIRAETLIMVAFGLTIGTIVAIPGLAVLSHDLTGSAVPSVPLWLWGGLVAFYALLGFAAGVVPTRLALRMDPVRAMAARE